MIINGINYSKKLLNLRCKLHSLIEDVPVVIVDTITHRSQAWHKGVFIGYTEQIYSIYPTDNEVFIIANNIKVEVI